MLVKTPLNTGEVSLSDGEFYWKQILPNEDVDYKGYKLRFGDPEYLKNIVAAFKDNALGEQTAFQLADDENAHRNATDIEKNRNFDPERYRGEIVDVEIRDDGLYGKLKPTVEGNTLIDRNKKLGVSAMIEENYQSHNGKMYPVVLRHLCGTINPHIKGMKNWEKALVSLSSTDDANKEVIDLTTTEDKKDEKVEDTEKISVNKADFEKMQEYIKGLQEEDAALEALMNDPTYTGDEEDETDDASEKQPATLSETDQKRLTATENKLAESEFNRQADKWGREGVPRAVIELARPALSTASSTVITLSSGESKDPKVIISAMLDELKGTIDLSEQKTHSLSEEEANDEKASEDDFTSFMTGLGNHF